MTESPVRKKILLYVFAVLAVGIALIISIQIDLLAYRASFAFFVAAVVISTWYGGRYPGVLSVILSALVAEYFLIPPIHSLRLDAAGAFELGVFLGVGLLISWLISAFQNREQSLRASEEAMRESEARLLNIFGNCPVAVVLSSWTDRRFVDVNAEFTRLTGWTRDEVVGRTGREIGLVDENEALDLRAQLEEQHALTGKEIRIKTKEGATRYVIMGTVVMELGGARHAVTTFVDISARRAAEEARTVVEEKLRIVTENARVGLVMLSDERRYTFTNSAYADILGLSAQDLLGKRVSDVLAPVYEEQIRPKLDRAFAGERVSYELHRPLGDGGDRYYAVNYEPLRTNDRISQVVVVITDITERTIAEAARRASEGRYRTLFEYAPDGILIADPQSYYLDANDAMCRMLGYTREDLVGMHASDIVILDEMQNIEPALDDINSGLGHHSEWVFRRKDGTRFLGEVIATQMPEGNLLGVVRDITDRKQEAAARDSLAAIVESSDDAIISKDLRGLVTSWNAAAEKMFGYTRKEMFGKSILRLIPPDRHGEEVEIMARIVRGEITDHFETVRTRKDGTLIDVSVTISPIRGPDGVVCGASKIVRNMTESKRLEEQLRQSQKLEAVGKLAGGVAHDFNNLLTAINGYSDLTLKKLSPDDPVRENVREIRRAGERAAALTGQLLAFSRKQVLKPTIHNLNSVISEMEKMLRRVISENIEFHVILEPHLGNINGDPGQMEQVILNLVINARDAMPGGGRLTIETRNVELDKDYVSQHIEIVPGPFVKMTITDSGEGMDEKTRQRMFDPFFTTKEVGKGTGLGLSTVYGIIKQSGGDIMVYSEKGHGTTFKIYLPRVNETETPVRPQLDTGNYFGTETILLVEDEDVVRNLTKKILMDFGYTVLEAPLGNVAVSICQGHPGKIHLLLTDMVMPGMSGVELKDRALESQPDLKLLFMSGYTDDSLSIEGLLDSGSAFIEKPFTPDALARKVREVLESSKK